MAHILFAVNDEPNAHSVIAFVADFFAKAGHRSEVVTDGAQAWERIQEACPDVLVCDLMLPNRDGFELLREVKRQRTNRAGTILLGIVQAQVGWYLTRADAFFPDVDALIIKPYSGDLQKLKSFQPLNYPEQLIVSVGHLLHRLDQYQTAA